MERNLRLTSRPKDAGFSLIELLVVGGIVAILAAIAVPNISQYIRNYRIRGATQEVANALQEARTRAIMRNATLGVTLALVTDTRYRVVYDDPVPNPADPANPIWEDQLGPMHQLPQGVEFSAIPSGTAKGGVRFTRLGALVDITMTNTPCKSSEGSKCAGSPTTGKGFGVSAAGAVLRLTDRTTGLVRDIRIAPGGRIQQQQ